MIWHGEYRKKQSGKCQGTSLFPNKWLHPPTYVKKIGHTYLEEVIDQTPENFEESLSDSKKGSRTVQRNVLH